MQNENNEDDAAVLIRIKSPKASVIKKSYVESGDRVLAGQPLFDLHTWEEQKILSEIERHYTETKIKLQEVQGKRVAQKLVNLTNIIAYRRAARAKSVEIRNLVVASYEDGAATLLEVIPRRQDAIARSFQLLQAIIERDLARRNVKDSLIVLKQVLAAIEREKTYVERHVDRLSIRAPVDGRIESFVNSSDPVKLGHILCEIHLRG
ncbi:hypothetical protein [Rhizobium leguminosarum]|uniref:hypothetical protein n=1 Tax=Rhizobium leguminosarum TaxID=384 RepID=UPI001C93DEF8|nr:hypothetical protein [Rhizobium leguminosarum]MBY5708074.1 hypothetical protein [Rhizobium leguminosarum]